jgi:hypothetical protein
MMASVTTLGLADVAYRQTFQFFDIPGVNGIDHQMMLPP